MNKELYTINFFFMSMMFSILMILSTNIMIMHPIMIIITTLIYSLIICMHMSMWKNNYLYSIMLFLIMISGLMIIFMYFSSLISNEQTNFKINKFIMMYYLFNSIIFWLLNYKLNFIYSLIKKHNFLESNYMMKFNEMNFQNILYLYEYPLNNLTISSMFYLLMTLFSVIKICSLKSISMRKIN